MHRPVGLTDTGARVIDPATSLRTVRLTVRDPAGTAGFYERVIGLRAEEQDDGRVALRAGDDRVLIELHGDSSAPRRYPRSPGLFHLAILMPGRRELAAALAGLAAARWPLSGASDHLVSEALYLSDPEGNGIEIYRDRPREQWPEENGTLSMATLPLDLENLVAELGDAPRIQPAAPAGTTIGHVHLQVADLAQAEDFYCGVLGFEVTVRGYPGALFVSAGGYHHHLGLNTWHSAGASPSPPGTAGLRNFDVVLPTAEALEEVLDRIRRADLAHEPQGGGTLVRDPSGNGVVLSAA